MVVLKMPSPDPRCGGSQASRPTPSWRMSAGSAATVGLGRIVALYHRHFILYSLTCSVPLFLKRQCDRILGGGLRRVPTPAKGHADFFLTAGGAFIIKQVKEAELRTVADIIPPYVRHLAVDDNGRRSLLNRMVAMFAIVIPSKRSVVAPEGSDLQAGGSLSLAQQALLSQPSARFFMVLESVFPAGVALAMGGKVILTPPCIFHE